MKTFMVTVRIWGLGGSEQREIKVEAKTAASAQKKVERMMGNREYCVEGVSIPVQDKVQLVFVTGRGK